VQREPIFAALFALGAAATWDNGRTWKTSSRRTVHFSKVEAQPAFFQYESEENIQQVTSMPYKSILKAHWIAYQNTGLDPKAIPATENNLILDALQAALAPQLMPGVQFVDRCTLGGLVYNVKICGSVMKYDGALEGQGIITIPLEILVP
jgi:hypothetical protein